MFIEEPHSSGLAPTTPPVPVRLDPDFSDKADELLGGEVDNLDLEPDDDDDRVNIARAIEQALGAVMAGVVLAVLGYFFVQPAASNAIDSICQPENGAQMIET